MSMSNYLCLDGLLPTTMSASTSPIGLDHPTTIPENFEPELHRDGEAESTEC